MDPCRLTIAYLAPELPALSATFVYEELLGLERRGVQVVPFSVHRPMRPAHGPQALALAQRTITLYEGGAAGVVAKGLVALPGLGLGVLRGLKLLTADMRAVGVGRPAAWKLAYQFLVGATLARLIRNASCSHLHVHFAHVPAQIGMYASAMSGIPFSVTGHANDLFERGLLLPQKAERATRFVTISEHNVQYLRSLGVADEKIAMVRCGVCFPASARRGQPASMTTQRRRIGTLGRLVEKKGMDVLIRAVADLIDQGSNIELQIAGDGPLAPGLCALAQQLGIEDRVVFAGPLAHEEVCDWLRTIDIFALACKPDVNGDMDGIPVVLMEAMSQGVPVVSTRLSGIPELVVHEQTGLLAAPGDVAELGAALAQLLADGALRLRLAEAAALHVQREFGQDINLDRLLLYITAPGAAQRHVSANLPSIRL